METKEILLKINNDKIWLNEKDFVLINNTDIPYKHLTFISHKQIFWKVQLKTYNKQSGKLIVEIVDYDCQRNSSFLNQKPKYKINSLEFRTFDWNFLEPILSSYKKSKLKHKLTNFDNQKIESKSNQGKQENWSTYSDVKIVASINNIEEKIAPVITKFEEEFAIDFNDSTFMLGYIRFSKFIKKLNKNIDFKITNENILPEFDNIKYWFSKKLKTKKFKVRVVFTLVDNRLSEFNAISKDIDNIDQSLIEGVKVQRTLEITKIIRPQNIDKALFTSDNIFDLYNSNDLEGNIFKQTEQDILDLLVEKSSVRNKKELSYLSGKKHSVNYRIRFTNHPNFGFIFLAEGELNNHFIWELLNSHATYVWSIEKGINELELQYKKIEATINTIMGCGREKYKRAYCTNHQDNDMIFNVIHHKDKNSQLIDEFPRWKQRINELIT